MLKKLDTGFGLEVTPSCLRYGSLHTDAHLTELSLGALGEPKLRVVVMVRKRRSTRSWYDPLNLSVRRISQDPPPAFLFLQIDLSKSGKATRLRPGPKTELPKQRSLSGGASQAFEADRESEALRGRRSS